VPVAFAPATITEPVSHKSELPPALAEGCGDTVTVPAEVQDAVPSLKVRLYGPVAAGVPVMVITGAVKLYDIPAGRVHDVTDVAPVMVYLISVIAEPAQTV
jgi:hypothetical protein